MLDVYAEGSDREEAAPQDFYQKKPRQNGTLL